MKRLIFITCLVLFSGGSYAQISDRALQDKLATTRNFYEMKKAVGEFYQSKAKIARDQAELKQIERKQKKWNRYFYESEAHLLPNGQVANVSKLTFDYLQSQSLGGETTLSSNRGAWELVGPTYAESGIGRINRIAIDPRNNQIVYAGSAGGGLFKSFNRGTIWQNLSSYFPSLGVSGIVVSHANSNVVYVLTGDGDGWNSGGFNFTFGYVRYSAGVLKSEDGGATFLPTGTFPDIPDHGRYIGFNLVQAPNNADVLMAATNQGIYRTTNGGASWVRSTFHSSTGENLGSGLKTYDIEYKPGSGLVVYCTASVGEFVRFFKSTDGGVNFHQIYLGSVWEQSTDQYRNNRAEIAVTPANANYVYLLSGPGFLTESNDDHRFKGLMRSTDEGNTFSLRSNSPDILAYDGTFSTFSHQSTYDIALAVSPTNANLVLVGALEVWRSYDGGATWDNIVDYHKDLDNSNYIHPDVHHLIYDPANSNAVFAATDGGVAMSTDNGSNWTRLFNGLSCTQFYKFELSNQDYETWAGAQDNGIMKQLSGGSFDNWDGGDGYDVLTDLPPAGNRDDAYWVINKQIWADGTWDIEVTPEQIDQSAAENYFPNLGMSPTNEDVIYAGYPDTYVSYDRGDSWFKIYGVIEAPGNWALATCRTNNKRIYTAGSNSNRSGLFRVDNLSDVLPDKVVDITNALNAAGYAGHKITDIHVSSNGSNLLWVTSAGYSSGNKVFVSSNSGESFTNISGSLPNFPAFSIISDANDNLYVGTGVGVYYRGKNDTDWTPFYNGLPRLAISELEFQLDINLNPYLYAATFGRGIWKTEAFGPCDDVLNVTSSLSGQRFYQAGSTLTSTSTVQNYAGTSVHFKAGAVIALSPNFTAEAGTDFSAVIGPCNNGLPLVSLADGTNETVLAENAIMEFKETGEVESAQFETTGIHVKVNIRKHGKYQVRLYDIAANSYIAMEEVHCAMRTCIVEFNNSSIDKNKFYRADLLVGNKIIYMQDVAK